MKIRVQLLAERPEAIPLGAEWLIAAWGERNKGHTPDEVASRLRARMSFDRIPMHLVALEGEAAVGFVALKLREMPRYTKPEREHWLGSLVVAPEVRGKGIGALLVESLVERARKRGVPMLTLQTERLDGGHYRRRGWELVGGTLVPPLQFGHYPGCLMAREALAMMLMPRNSGTWLRHRTSWPGSHRALAGVPCVLCARG